MAKTVTCDWNHLSRRRQYESNPLLTSDVPRLSAAQTVDLVRDLVALMAVLHRHGLVIGTCGAGKLRSTAQARQRPAQPAGTEHQRREITNLATAV